MRVLLTILFVCISFVGMAQGTGQSYAGGGSVETIIPVKAEENGALNDNQFEYSFGNGATNGTNPSDWGQGVPYNGTIDKLHFSANIGGAGVTEVAVTINGTQVGSIVVAGGVSRFSTTFATPIPFVADDVINFQTITAGGANKVVMSAYCKITF